MEPVREEVKELLRMRAVYVEWVQFREDFYAGKNNGFNGLWDCGHDGHIVAMRDQLSNRLMAFRRRRSK